MSKYNLTEKIYYLDSSSGKAFLCFHTTYFTSEWMLSEIKHIHYTDLKQFIKELEEVAVKIEEELNRGGRR